MPAMICTHCGVQTNVLRRRDQLELLAPELHCRACERSGGMRPAVRDRVTGVWRVRTETDPPDLDEIRIEGSTLSLLRVSVLQVILRTCQAHPGTWFSENSLYGERTHGAQLGRDSLAWLVARGALELVGLEVKRAAGGAPIMFRARAITADGYPRENPRGYPSAARKESP
ncbi:MAG: hypothetical protein ABSA30_00200 [Candidatus Aminicenantales bacterium]